MQAVRDAFTSDQEIVDAIQSGVRREEALAWVYRACNPIAKELGRQFAFSSDDAADVLQDAVIVFYTKVINRQLTLTARITTYLHRVCRNMFAYRKRGTQSMPLAAIEDDDIAAAEEEEGLEELLAAQDQQLTRLLAELGERCRDLLVEFYGAGTAMKALAAKYHYSNAETVTAQKYKCLMQLKRKFQVP